MIAKAAVLYARVSQEAQDAEGRVSIDQQLEDMNKLCERQGWVPIETFIDREMYVKTHTPHKGKRMNPSGEYDDRPALLAMLEVVRTGQPDVIVCWRDDRLVRHPRVSVVIEDALDEGDKQRKGKDPIRLFDANGSEIDRFVLGIKAQVWREENKRKTERIQMGKRGTLQAGFWPGPYIRLGYTTEPAQRGNRIVLVPNEARIVQLIFDLCEQGFSKGQIHDELRARGYQQKGSPNRKYEWSVDMIYSILRARDYVGEATWKFADGMVHTIEIPQIISLEQWEFVQEQLDANASRQERNTQHLYVLQHILECGACHSKISPYLIRYFYKELAGGERKRYTYDNPKFSYRCVVANKRHAEDHPKPIEWAGQALEEKIWWYFAERVFVNPDLITRQIRARQAELARDYKNVEGEIGRTKQQVEKIKIEMLNYHRRAAQGYINEKEYENLIDDARQREIDLVKSLDHLTFLRDNELAVNENLLQLEKVMGRIQDLLPWLNMNPYDDSLPQEERTKILEGRRDLIRGLVEKIMIFPNGLVIINGMIGQAVSQFELDTLWKGSGIKLTYALTFDLYSAAYPSNRSSSAP